MRTLFGANLVTRMLAAVRSTLPLPAAVSCGRPPALAFCLQRRREMRMYSGAFWSLWLCIGACGASADAGLGQGTGGAGGAGAANAQASEPASCGPGDFLAYTQFGCGDEVRRSCISGAAGACAVRACSCAGKQIYGSCNGGFSERFQRDNSCMSKPASSNISDEADAGAADGGEHPNIAAADCDALRQNIVDARSAFKPDSPNTCMVDADCTTLTNSVVRTSQVCLDSDCGLLGARAYVDEYTTFLKNDPELTTTCEAALQAGCKVQPHGCPCAVLDPGAQTCRPPRCTAGTCE